MQARNFKSLFDDEVESLFSAESQIATGLAAVAKAVFTKELAQLLNEQAKESTAYSRSLQDVLSRLERKRPKNHVDVVRLLLKDCADASKRFENGNLRDAAHLLCLQRLDHHQAAAYTSTLALANQLGEEKIPVFLKAAATSYELAAKHCTQIALQVNAEAFIDTHTEKCAPVV